MYSFVFERLDRAEARHGDTAGNLHGGSWELGVPTRYTSRVTDISLDRRVRISDDAVFRELDGEAVILQLDSGTYFGLDLVGTRLWQLMNEHGHLRSVFAAAVDEFDVEPVVLERDLLQLVRDLLDKGLIEVN